MVISGSEYCRRLVERNFNKTLVKTEKNYENFINSTKYRICKKQHKQKDIIVKDHRRITEKFRGSVHNEFNLNLSLTKKDPCCVSQLAKLLFTSYISRTWKI